MELTKIPQAASILDVASGRGASLIPAARRVGSRVPIVGIDLSARMLHEAVKEIVASKVQNARMLRMDAEALGFHDASFDFVLCGFGLDLFPQVYQALREFYRVLKPGGTLSVCTWAADCSYLKWLAGRFGHHLPNLPSPNKKATLGARSALNSALENTGYRVADVAAAARDFYYADEEQWWSSLWSYGFRELLERLDPLTLAELKASFFRDVRILRQGNSIRVPLRALFALGSK